MQFDFDPEIKGDLEVKARGTESLMANEVRSQRLMQFLQVASNPALAPFAKMDYIIREIAKSMDLDPEKVTNDKAEAMLMAEMMKSFQQQPQGQPPAGANPNDPTGSGGGTIGTGMAPDHKNKDLQVMHNHKDLLNHLKPLCNNPKLWDAFVEYIEYHIENHTRIMEQTDNQDLWKRSQGSLAILRKLQSLRDEVNVKEIT